MKNKFLSGVLISMAFPVCGHAAPVTGDALNIGTGNTVLAGSKSGAIGTQNSAANDSLSVGGYSAASNSSMSVGVGIEAYNSSLVGGESSTMDEFSGASLLFGQYVKAYGIVNSAIFGTSNRVNQDAFGSGGSGGLELSLLTSGSGNYVYREVGQQGSNNILLGNNNQMDVSVSGSDSMMNGSALIGVSNKTSKTESWVIGKGNIGQTGAVTLGTYGSVVTEPASLVVGTGSGTGPTPRTNGLVVLKDGRVQIPGSLEIGGEGALTATSVNALLSSGGYLKSLSGVGATSMLGAFTAWGYNARAVGSGNMALGHAATADGGNHNFAFGEYTTAFGTGVTAFNAEARGTQSFAAGGSYANGRWSVALGSGGAEADLAIAMAGGLANGKGSIALGGYATEVSGNFSSGLGATSIGGVDNISSGSHSFTSGYQLFSRSAHAVAFGSRNLTKGGLLSSADTTSWVETEALFELGNGKPSLTPAQYSNAITTLKNGQTKLTNKFWVSATPGVVPAATEASAGEALVVEGHTVLKGNTKLAGKVTLEEAQGDISMGIYQ